MISPMRLMKSLLTTAAISSIFCPSAQAQVPTVQFGYDLAGRVASALYDDGTCVTYTYDSVGNRTAQVNSSTIGSSIWGSGAWGCSSWSSGPALRATRSGGNARPAARSSR